MYGGRKEKDEESAAQKRSQESSPAPPWMVRAEVTIRAASQATSDRGQQPVGTSSTVADSNGVRMIYRWNTSQSSPLPPSSTPTTPAIPSIATIPPNSYGFQRGNILFTSTPPPRVPPPSGSFTIPRSTHNDDSNSSRGGRGFNDSGYNSERFSPQSYSSLPSRRPSQQYNRRCKSTCNIVLAAFDPRKNLGIEPPTTNPQTNEAYKFSSNQSDRPAWHYRATTHHQHVSARSRFSTVPEVCEDCAEGSNASPFTTHFCTRVPEKTARKKTTVSKDASSQTTDIESRASSSATSKIGKTRRKALDINLADEQKRKKQEETSTSHASIGTSTCSTVPTTDTEKSDGSTIDDNAKRKSRTVHIDVYCTGSDDECAS